MVKDISFPYAEVPKDLLFINSVSQFLIGLVVLGIGALFLKKYLERRTKALQYVALTYVTFGLSLVIGSWQGLIAWWQYDNVVNPHPLVWGLPLLVGNLTWPFNAIAYGFNMASLILLMLFIESVFERPRRTLVLAYMIIGILWIIIFPVGNGIFLYIPTGQYKTGGSSVTFIGLVTFLILGSIAHGLLTSYALEARKREKNPLVRDGLSLLALAGLTVLFAYLVFVVNGLLTLNFDFLAWIVGVIAVIFVYLGFGMPDWFVKYLKRRHGFS